MAGKIPNQDILSAFGTSGEPILLPGGEGTCYRVGDIVLKPTKDVIEASWITEINNNLASDKFRVPKSIRAKNGAWNFDGWSASEFLQGKHRPGNYAEAIEVSMMFHKALADIPKPDWFNKKTDVFTMSDRMAWSEMPIYDFDIANKPLKKLFSLLRENRLPSQLIHGDWGLEQILFHDTLTPAVLDMTPYFRPKNYPIADMLISAMANDSADESILDLGNDINDFDQLILHAMIFRTCTYIGFQIHPENNYDWTSTIIKYLDLVNPVIEKIEN
ncbi:hypothetical protein KKB10_04190 [Patescibacteria group bacterium]|nr:hypothetical protein [Patescibacteria group bacterium]MBU1951699.1 hypothetical protein [Patescibacteria group bacterium]